MVFLLTEKSNLMCKKLSSHRKILYMNIKNVLTKKEERQNTITRKSLIVQLSTTGREGSARNIRKEKKCLSSMERRTVEKAPKQRLVIFREVTKVGKNEDMYK